ncbi:hypothetical protein BD769DRAFT_1776911 [Suillus cothurnatus]|nr:hypothetical protein BD769DRAFT_1776911 [Suillus cothurnatus]
MVQHAQLANCVLSERLGAQGLFEYNRLSNLYSEMRGVSIAEEMMVESMGHRMAYDAAVDQGVSQCLIDLYLVNAIKTDAAWYVERGIFTRQTITHMEDTALLAALPRLDELLAAMEVEPYVSPPIISNEYWEKFSETLPVFSSPQAEVPAQSTFLERAQL